MFYDRLLGAGVLCFQSFSLSICYFVSVYRALGQTHSLTSFGFSVGSWGLAMCVAVKRWRFYSFNVFSNVVLNSFSLL